MSPVVVGLGLMFGAGVLLAVAPWLWPAVASAPRRRNGVMERMRIRLVLAGFSGVPVSAVVVVSVICGLGLAAVAQALFSVSALSLAVGVLGFVLPALIVVWRARARRAAHRTVWPDVVDHLVSAVRAGLALPDAVASLATSGPSGTRSIFAGFAKDYAATGNFSVCLDDLKRAFADPVADRLIETLRMAREVGAGDLVEVLRGLAGYLREDTVVRAELRARQSWVVNAARLGVIAPWLVLLLLVSRPEGAAAYNSPTGGAVILLGLLVSAIAYRLMIRVGRLPEEQRWFR